MRLTTALDLQAVLHGGSAADTYGYDDLAEAGGRHLVGMTAFAEHLRGLGVLEVWSVHDLPGASLPEDSDPLWTSALATGTATGPGAGWTPVRGPERRGGEGRPFRPTLWVPGPPLVAEAADGARLRAAVVELDASLRAVLDELAGTSAGRAVRVALQDLRRGEPPGRTDFPGPPALSALARIVDADLRQVLIGAPAAVLGSPATMQQVLHPLRAAPGGPLEHVHRAGLAVLRQAAAHLGEAAAGRPVSMPPMPTWPPLPAAHDAPAPLSAAADPQVRAAATALDEALIGALDQLRATSVTVPDEPVQTAGRWWSRRRRDAPPRRDLALERSLVALAGRFQACRDVLSGARPAPDWVVADPLEQEGGTTATRLHAAGQLVLDVAAGAPRGEQPAAVAAADLTVLLGPRWPALLDAAQAVEPLSRPLHRWDRRAYRPPRDPAWWQRR